MNTPLTRAICCELAVDTQDHATLAATPRAFNAAASWMAPVCWDEELTNTQTAPTAGTARRGRASAWGLTWRSAPAGRRGKP